MYEYVLRFEIWRFISVCWHFLHNSYGNGALSISKSAKSGGLLYEYCVYLAPFSDHIGVIKANPSTAFIKSIKFINFKSMNIMSCLQQQQIYNKQKLKKKKDKCSYPCSIYHSFPCLKLDQSLIKYFSSSPHLNYFIFISPFILFLLSIPLFLLSSRLFRTEPCQLTSAISWDQRVFT